jgi:hypothetical protein
MRKVYFVSCGIVHRISKKRMDWTHTTLKEFEDLDKARELYNEFVESNQVYVGKEDYKVIVCLYEPLRLRSTGKLTTMIGKGIDEFSFIGEFFIKEDKNLKVEG